MYAVTNLDKMSVNVTLQHSYDKIIVHKAWETTQELPIMSSRSKGVILSNGCNGMLPRDVSKCEIFEPLH